MRDITRIQTQRQRAQRAKQEKRRRDFERLMKRGGVK